jgi:hypothetical protein
MGHPDAGSNSTKRDKRRADEPTLGMLVISTDQRVHDAVRECAPEHCVVTHFRTSRWSGGALGTLCPNLVLLDAEVDHTLDDLLASVSLRWPRARLVIALASPKDARVSSLASRAAVVFKPLDVDRLRHVIEHWLRLAAMSSGVRDLLSASGLGAGPEDAASERDTPASARRGSEPARKARAERDK